MLEPQERSLLFDALRPPPGYQLDTAVGTTYSLDLLALATVPVAFTLFDIRDRDEKDGESPLALVEALRRSADRLALFCQEDRILVPTEYRPFFAYLEESVVPVRPPARGSFHPKVWALRFTSQDEPVKYRLLVMTRNLTFDRSWDTILALDGELANRRNAFSSNHPLGDLFRSLPGSASGRVPDRIRQQVDTVQHELRRVRFELPGDVDEVSFWPIGIDGYQSWPFSGRIDRLLLMSRFLSQGCLARFEELTPDRILISDPDALAAIESETLGRFDRVFVFQDGLEPEPDEELLEESPEPSSVTPPAGEHEPPPVGLHAKLYVADAGSRARIWTGSANATDASFSRNVEFLVELVGRKSRLGIDALLGEGRDGIWLHSLLTEYMPEEVEERDEVLAKLEVVLDQARRELAGLGLVVNVSQGTVPEEYALTLSTRRSWAPPEGVAVTCRPITLRESAALKKANAGQLCTFDPVSFEAITPFIAFTLTARHEAQSAGSTFALNLPLVGAPADRAERLLSYMLGDKDQVLRYLLLLLAEAADGPADALALLDAFSGKPSARRSADAGLPLLEVMVKALHRSPESLDRVARLIEDLRRTEEGQELLPAGLDEIWGPIWTARKALKA